MHACMEVKVIHKTHTYLSQVNFSKRLKDGTRELGWDQLISRQTGDFFFLTQQEETWDPTIHHPHGFKQDPVCRLIDF